MLLVGLLGREVEVRFADTGQDTNTGGRLARIRKYIKDDLFMATYGDGLADINLKRLIKFHRGHRRVSTITVVKPYSPFGIVGVDADSQIVTHFEEKPLLDHWINGGFFVFNKKVFDFLKTSDVLEKDTFGRMVRHKEIAAYKHHGYWQCMDTYKDHLKLNELWAKRQAPWALWKSE